MSLPLPRPLLKPLAAPTLLALTLLMFIWPVLNGGPMIISQNMADLFIPYNVAFGQAMVVGSVWHSPFGFLYPLLYQTSAGVMQMFGFAANTLIPLTSLLVGLPVVLAFVLARGFSRTGMFLNLYWLAFIFGWLCTLRRTNELGAHELPWYSTYNMHSWAFYMVALLMVLSWKITPPRLWQALAGAVLLAVIGQLMLFYKISFALAMLPLILAAVCTLDNWRDRGLMLAVFSLVSTGLGWWGIELTQQLHPSYWQDVLQAFAAKAGARLPVAHLALGFAVMVGLMHRHRQRYPADWQTPAFIACLTGGVVMGIQGDYFQPTILLALFLACLWQATATPYNRWPGRAVLLVFTLILASNLYGAARIIRYQLDLPEGYALAPIHVAPLGEDAVFAYKQRPGYELYVDVLKLRSNPELASSSEKIAFSNPPFSYNIFTSVITSSYVAILQDGAALLASRHYPANTRIAVVDFTNPFPLMLGLQFPDRWQHWLHIGTTMKLPKHLPVLYDYIRTADVVMLPVISTVPPQDKVALNKAALQLIGQYRLPFTRKAVTPYWILLERQGLKPLPPLSQPGE